MSPSKRNLSAHRFARFHLVFGLVGGVLILLFLSYAGGHPAAVVSGPVPLMRLLMGKAVMALLIWVAVLGIAARYFGRLVRPGTLSYGKLILSSSIIVIISSSIAAGWRWYWNLMPPDLNFLHTFQYFFFLGIFVAIIITALAYQGYRRNL